MKKHFWKIEYGITFFVIFAITLFLIPASFSSKEAKYITRWNHAYTKIDYMFTAMGAQADSDIAKGIKNAKSDSIRENLMIHMVEPYLRLRKLDFPLIKYQTHYMNGKKVQPGDLLYFDQVFISENNRLVGIKTIDKKSKNSAIFVMMVDVNGLKGPNTWGKDVYGVEIYKDGKITALGKDKTIEELKQDCSSKGKGVYCSQYYRIGGDFIE